MRHLDLFSGIGGFALAAKWMGWETVAFCEREQYARRVLEQHWPGVPIIDDITRWPNERIGCDIITGGFPCQPFSCAGKQAGKQDDRYLWPAMLSVIERERPTWVVGENVFGIIKMALDQVLSDLEAIGYATRAFVIPACAVDAHHRRDRVWIVARDDSNTTRIRFQGLKPSASHAKGSAKRIQSESARVCWSEHVDDANCVRRDQKHKEMEGGQAKLSDITSGQSNLLANANGIKWQMLPKESLSRKQNIQGQLGRSSQNQRNRWPSEPNVCRVVNGLPNRTHRIKGLGNAIVPQVAYEIFNHLEAFSQSENDSALRKPNGRAAELAAHNLDKP